MRVKQLKVDHIDQYVEGNVTYNYNHYYYHPAPTIDNSHLPESTVIHHDDKKKAFL